MFTRVALVLALGLCATAVQLRINCGGPYLPSIGWRKDTGIYRSANSLGYSGDAVVNTSGNWGAVYKSHAYSFGGDLQYTIPVPNATYSVYLLFSEPGLSRQRHEQFSLSVNGETVVAVLDVFAAANGAFKPVYITKKVVVTDGYVKVTLGRIAGKNNPMISGIVVDGADPAALVGNEGIGTDPTRTPTVSVSAAPSASASVGVTPSASASVSVSPSASASATASGPTCAHTVKMNVAGSTVADFGPEDTSLISGPTGLVYTSSDPVSVAPGSNLASLFLTERYTLDNSLTYKIPLLPVSTT